MGEFPNWINFPALEYTIAYNYLQLPTIIITKTVRNTLTIKVREKQLSIFSRISVQVEHKSLFQLLMID